MPITAERYIPDRGSVTVNTTEVNGSVKTVSWTAPRRAERIINSLGGAATETQTRVKAGNYEVSLTIFDDQSLNHTITGLMGVMWLAYENGTELTDMAIAPAGSTLGMTEYTLGGSIHVVECPPAADMDADTEEEATADVIVVCETVTPAQIA